MGVPGLKGFLDENPVLSENGVELKNTKLIVDANIRKFLFYYCLPPGVIKVEYHPL